MRHLTTTIALIATLALAGCLFSPAKSSSPVRYRYTVEIAGLNQNGIVSWDGVTFDLIVSGTAATVTVAPNQRIRNLTIGGSASDVLIGSSSSVSGTVTLSGTNAVLHLPAGSPITATITGAGALVVYDSSAG